MKNFFTLLLAAVTIFFAACTNESPANVTQKETPVDEPFPLTFDGKISLSGESEVLSPISGNVVATYFERGQFVEEGQPLFKVGKQQDESALLQARAELGESMTALARSVAEKNPAAEELREEVAERQARVQRLEDVAAAGIVYSPTAGQIGMETAKLGATISANETVLATIGTSDPATVRVEISDDEKNLLMTSDALKVTLKLDDGTIYPREGKINFVGASTLAVTFDNPIGRLNLGDAAQIVITRD